MWKVRIAERDDAPAWLQLRCALWPEATPSEHHRDIERFFAGALQNPQVVLLAEEREGTPLGLAEVSIRIYAEGCTTDRIAYLEGWYVVPERRRQGLGYSLVAAAEAWGRAQGCTELASDADPANEASLAAHRALGFIDAGLIRCFHKKL